MDDEQKQDFLRGVNAGLLKNPEQDNKFGFLVPWQKKEFKRLTAILEEKYKGNFAGLTNLISLGVSILAIIVWYIWIFPFFN